MAGSQDTWRISGEERSKHDMQFFQLKPVNGFVTGTQARDFFIQSGLPTPVLGQIWSLADINGDGKMDKKEFSIAMHLIKKKLQGYELPKVLPASLKADPTPAIGSFAQPAVGGVPMSQPIGMGGFSMGGIQTSVGMGMPVGPLIQPQASLGTATMTTGSLGLGPLMSNGVAGSFTNGGMALPLSQAGVPRSSSLQPGGSIWAMPHTSKIKHSQTFNISDRNKRGFLLGVEARSILMQSGLPHPVLAQIWALSDVDRDGKLTCDEFCIAMHLAELARMGQVLPTALPQELSPGRTGSLSINSPLPSATVPGSQKDAFGDLLGSVGMPLPVSAAQPVEDDEQVSFEDKRKENFDKGQAELERRRSVLREQQQKEENERLEKERNEAEKRERQRQDAENRRQAELQRQLEKQREKERDIEEQRRKMLDQREAARRELERQRQMEWENQRKEQLVVEKERESEHLRVIKSQMANLRNELETLDSKKTELTLKISQIKKGVTDFTTSIDAMRMTRDRTLADIDVFGRQTMELNKKFSALGSEKDELNIQVQTAETTPLSDAYRTVSQSVELKKANIQKLKKDLEMIESNTEARLREIDHRNSELKNLKEQLVKLERDIPQLQKKQEDKTLPQKKVTPKIPQKPKTEKESQGVISASTISNQGDNAQPSWFDFSSSEAVSSVPSGGTNSDVMWDTAFSGTPNTTSHSSKPAAWGTGGTTITGGGLQNKQKYRAMYDFPAGREDELTLVAGKEVWVLTDFTPVPGMEDWYKGESQGKVGWFPKAYVERRDEPSTDLFGGAFESLVQSSSVQKSEPAQQELFSSQISQSSAISGAPATSSIEASVPSNIPPEGLLAKAIYPWKARQETDLTFDKDDVILVKQQLDMKWYGELNEKSGWFPKAYVKLTGAAPKPGSTITATTDLGKPADTTSTAPSETQGEYYVAMYVYTSDEPTDLNFNEGDIICVTASSGDWWSGVIADQGKSGIFPSTYVKKLEIQPSRPAVSSHVASSNYDSLLGDFSIAFAPTSAQTSSNMNLMDDLFAASEKHDVNVDDIDAIGMSLGEAEVLSVAADSSTAEGSINSSSGAPLSTEIRPVRSLTASKSFDMIGMPGLGTVKKVSRPNSSSAITQPKNNLLADFDQLISSKLGSNLSWSSFDLTSPEGIVSEHLKHASNDKSATFEPSHVATSELDWGFGDFAKTSTSQPSASSVSLLDDFGLISNSNTSNISDAVTKGSIFDVMDDFGFGGPADSLENANKTLRSSMSLPDILALENDAIQGDLFETQNTASIMKSHNMPISANHTSSVVQVDFDMKTQKIGSKPAPRPPLVKSLFGISKKKTPEQKSVKKPEIAKVIAPYVATGTGQLSLEIGNLINVRQKSPRGWWEGELQVRGQKKKTGWFPANYVKLLGGSSARSTPEPTAAAALAFGTKGSQSATPQGLSSLDGIFSLNQSETVIALYPYAAQNEDELTFQKDDVITILSRDNPDWWSGQVNGQTGVFPSNYVTTNPQSQSLPPILSREIKDDKERSYCTAFELCLEKQKSEEI